MSDSDLLVDADGPVTTITLNRPDAKNTLSASMLTGLVRALGDAVESPDTRVIVLTNTGNTFCAGADLTATRPGVSGSGHPAGTSLPDVFGAIRHARCPVIGKIDGHAVGGGVGLMAACDLSYVRSDATIGFTEVRLGVAPAIISVVCLPKLGRADAMEAFLTGRRFSPVRAVEMGLINAAVDPADLDAHVIEVIDAILLGGPSAVRTAKELVNRVPAMNIDAAIGWTTSLSQSLFDSDEAREGIQAFRERRLPSWAPSQSG